MAVLRPADILSQPFLVATCVKQGTVALANKMARICWVVLSSDQSFDMKRAFKPAA